MSELTIAKLVQSSPCAHALICAYSNNHPLLRYADVRDAYSLLQSIGQAYPQSAIYTAFTDMEICGLGQWSHLSKCRDDPAIFCWTVLPIVASEALRTGLTLQRDETTEDDYCTPDWRDEIPRQFQIHRFFLRPNCTVRIELPAELNREDVRRLKLFLSSLECKTLLPRFIEGDDLSDEDTGELEDDEDDCIDVKRVKDWFGEADVVEDLSEDGETNVPVPVKPPESSG